MASIARMAQQTTFSFVDEDADGRAAKRQNRQSLATAETPSFRNNTQASSAKSSMDLDARQSVVNRRRSVLREHKVPLGPRPPDFTSAKRTASESTNITQVPSTRSFLPSNISEPFLGLSSRRTTTNFDFNNTNASASVSNGVGTNDGNLPARVPRMGDSLQNENIRSSIAAGRGKAQKPENGGVFDELGRSQTGSIRSNAQAENTALRAAQMSTASANNTQTAPLSIRTRRQSQFPPSAAQAAASARQPRKSLGPGTLPVDRVLKPFGDGLHTTLDAMKTPHIGIGPVRRISNPRAKPRISMGPINTRISPVKVLDEDVKSAPVTQPTNSSNSTLTFSGNTQPPKQTHVISRAQGDSDAGDTAIPGLSRKSIHGLSRTVSPTDVWKARRSSNVFSIQTVQDKSPSPESPPVPHPSQELPQSNSKPASPPSSRTTPDHNVRFSGGRSLSSRSSFSSQRPPSSSWQQPQRHSSRSAEGKLKVVTSSDHGPPEQVPPVPCIPKVYESPNQTIDEPFFESFEVQPDTESPKKESAPSSYRPSLIDERPVNSRDSKFLRRFTLGGRADATKSRSISSSSSSRQASETSRLPPLNLGPLNLDPAKITAMVNEQARIDLTKSTPPRYNRSRPPSTPLTASKATFSTTVKQPDTDQPPMPYSKRSTSGQHHIGDSRPSSLHRSESSSSNQLKTGPKFDVPRLPNTLKVSNTQLASPNKFSDTELSHTSKSANIMAEAGSEHRSQLGRNVERDMTDERSAEVETVPERTSRMSIVATPTRRKIGLGFRRNSSKTSHDVQSSSEGILDPARDSLNMPPPKVPASKLPTESHFLNTSLRIQKSAELKVLGMHAPGSIGANAMIKSQTQEAAASDRALPRQLSSHRLLFSRTPTFGTRALPPPDQLDVDDLAAEEEMKKLASKRKEFEEAAKDVETLQRKAKPKERVSPGQATRAAQLNMFERGEVIDYNDIYFTGTKGAKKLVGDLSAHSANFGYDDDRGDYNIVEGDHLAYRYQVLDLLGKGSFGQVVRCIDHKEGKLVAVKIIRNKKRFHQQALVEVNILQRLREWDPENQHCMINFTESFYFRGHLCIASELLGINLYEFIKAHDFRGFSLKLVRRFAKQMLSCLSLLQSRKVIHCDLKPENILLVHPLRSELKTIDFGSSCFEHEKVYTYIQSRFYRSPEVILGIDYGMPIDMWSMGCILAELYTGYPIFPGENEQEQLACIMEIFGPPEKQLIEKSTRKKVFFDSMGKPRVTVSSKGKRRRPSSKTLQQAIKCDDEAFLDFLTKCLRWDPERRLKPEEAMAHEFIAGSKNRSRQSLASSPVRKPLIPSRTPSRTRPLPEAPALAPKRTANAAPVSSPVKVAIPPRRQSTMTAAAAGTKRSSNGAMIASTLPRSVSGKPDMASAAALHSLRQNR